MAFRTKALSLLCEILGRLIRQDAGDDDGG